MIVVTAETVPGYKVERAVGHVQAMGREALYYIHGHGTAVAIS